MNYLDRPNPASVKVICLGYSRTGTSSLCEALGILGFGPCYHMWRVLQQGINHYPAWFKISDGNGTPNDFDALFNGYASVLDCPAAMFPTELFAAYPDAKYILTTRDPAKWEQSMKATLLRAVKAIRALPVRSPIQETLSTWNEKYLLAKYHCGRLYTHTQQELLDHNERVKRTIPADQLLVYEVGEGWDKLIEFLNVPKPAEPFPHVNDTAQFQDVVIRKLAVEGMSEDE